jgi:hypothetical protein
MVRQLVLAVLVALASTAASAADPIVPLRGETALAFQCRAAHIPEVRRCSARCDAAYAGAAEARWGCVQACSGRGLWAMSECRASGGGASGGASASLASR